MIFQTIWEEDCELMGRKKTDSYRKEHQKEMIEAGQLFEDRQSFLERCFMALRESQEILGEAQAYVLALK